MDADEQHLITSNFNWLIRHLQQNAFLHLVDSLLAKGVLVLTFYEDFVQSTAPLGIKVRKVLCVVLRSIKPNSFLLFCEALEDTGFSEACKLLRSSSSVARNAGSETASVINNQEVGDCVWLHKFQLRITSVTSICFLQAYL